ncbi:MAG: c-type cytochrome [Betaproteobacteria bacterium]
MNNNSGTDARPAGFPAGAFIAAAFALLAVIAASAPAAAASGERSGKDVVQATCGACHTTGKDGAPKIGDQKAWGKLTALGLTGLTKVALSGIRKMPAHGGSPDASDLEISRAITYMVNRSGGKWIEPVGGAAPPARIEEHKERTGQQIVHIQCDKCHHDGIAGAPMIGDRTAWVQRLKRGMDEVVRSAFNGHGPMPARGGMADITVNEMRNAITYMFNPASATLVAPVALPVAPRDPFHKIVGNTEIFFGITSADSIRTAQKNRRMTSIADVPDGADYYHVNVSLRERTTQVLVTNAQVEARVEDPAQRGESKPLDIMAINKGISYGGFFQLATKGRYLITVKVQRPDALQPAEARFEYVRN